MNGKDLSRQLSDLPEELIAEAMAPAKDIKRKHFAVRLLRVAAIAAALAILITAVAFWPTEENYITGPGVLVVRAYGAEYEDDVPVEGVVLEEGVEFTSTVIYNPTISYRQHFPFTFSVEDSLYSNMEITLEVNADAGIFYKNEPYDPDTLGLTRVEKYLARYYGQHFFVNADKAIYWKPSGFDYAYMQEAYKPGESSFEDVYIPMNFEKSPAFIDVVIRADDNIVGYCVIAICEINIDDGHPDQEFSFTLLTMVGFPQIEGRWQNVTEEYVWKQIYNIHTEREALS